MFSAWDFNSWTGSFVIVLLMFSLIAAFSAFLSILFSRILGEESDVETPRMSRPAKEAPFRKAA